MPGYTDSEEDTSTTALITGCVWRSCRHGGGGESDEGFAVACTVGVVHFLDSGVVHFSNRTRDQVEERCHRQNTKQISRSQR